MSTAPTTLVTGDFVTVPTQDLDAARAYYVTFDARDVLDSGVWQMPFFKDPDANALMLHHRYAPRTPPN